MVAYIIQQCCNHVLDFLAEKLKISQSAVNQRKKRAGWTGIEALINRYEKIINKEI